MIGPRKIIGTDALQTISAKFVIAGGDIGITEIAPERSVNSVRDVRRPTRPSSEQDLEKLFCYRYMYYKIHIITIYCDN